MARPVTVLLLIASLWSAGQAATERDLSSRITVDGRVLDYESDEWIVDETTAVPELAGDSRWGSDNDIRRVALTWDEKRLYIAVDAVTRTTTLMLFVDVGCEGVNDLYTTHGFRRNVAFSGLSPNFLVGVSRRSIIPLAGLTDCNTPFFTLDDDTYSSAFFQDDIREGGLEVAIPWALLGDFEGTADGTRVPVHGQSVKVVSIVSSGPGTGAGDAAPDPTAGLENDSLRVAIINNYVNVPLDGDDDGYLDIGVSPRDEATYGAPGSEPLRQRLPVTVLIDRKAFAPDLDERLRFRALLDGVEYSLPVFLTARVYSSDGQLVRDLYENEPRDLSPGATPVWDEWDGRDNNGNVVAGGVFVLAVSAGIGAGSPAETKKQAVAVVR